MKKVLLLLANGFEEYEAGAFTDVLGWSRAFGNVPIEVTQRHIICYRVEEGKSCQSLVPTC